MEPISFAQANKVYAKDQPQYIPLPVNEDVSGIVTHSWRFSWEEKLAVLIGKPLWIQVMNFGKPLQPIKPSMNCPLGKDGGK